MSVAETLEAEDVSCADTRSAVRSVLLEACFALPPHEATRLRDDALLVVSELTTNALLHAGGVTRFTACLTGGELQLRVSDRSVEVPRRLPTVPGRPGGYGWMVVQRLASRVSVEVGPEGKTIVAALALPGPLTRPSSTGM
ncbi:ATP-binding protein [Streptomyces sp. SID8379]|uniref:ATP-binding protein n=1 Tax=unclassified Streptomyces TaxID=2593676 RepID=UPI000382B900|nr:MULTISPECIES: ATP-binding protein [unclassified Streptomyces]MYW70096.1 ATP-binding protein [Streptomyces sp. SID8379]